MSTSAEILEYTHLEDLRRDLRKDLRKDHRKDHKQPWPKQT